MNRNMIETVMGGVVLAVAVLFFFFAYSTSDVRSVDGYQLVARFDRIDGLSPGADVRISGVRVGQVISQQLDPQTYLAEVRMVVDDSVRLPADTIATVASESLLGGRYMALDPGGAAEMIEAGGVIQFTQSTPSLEQLIGQAIYGLGEGDGGDGTGNGGSDSGSAGGSGGGLLD